MRLAFTVIEGFAKPIKVIVTVIIIYLCLVTTVVNTLHHLSGYRHTGIGIGIGSGSGSGSSFSFLSSKSKCTRISVRLSMGIAARDSNWLVSTGLKELSSATDLVKYQENYKQLKKSVFQSIAEHELLKIITKHPTLVTIGKTNYWLSIYINIVFNILV